ncbi:hypothetical protein [Bacillus weihaiensis]|uniref:Group-specific protein n=1 Tax=Bacillus weihaiensis TaxID=1547283 RepID=A0A1L3MQQ8_9BACI|nr:hypothetical protein [Bacillus weihaiensis]APH04685.1 hypothetical protein A9C19_07950 [Bacillus weihaiensis]
MFDPTVFDNLKVVIEGYIYDLDLEKELSVTNRSDIVDLATMSRRYSLTFVSSQFRKTYVTIEISMDQEQLAGELLQTITEPGCHVVVSFVEEARSQDYDELFYRKLKKCWGNSHNIHLILMKEKTNTTTKYIHNFNVDFINSFGENNLEKLLNIVDQSISLLKQKSES